jgi:DNA-binding CsgD family transcriptional regulator
MGRPIAFTSRQRQILLLLLRGCTTVEMAQSLGISARTVKAHCDVLRHKLGVEHRRQVPAAYARAAGVPLTELISEAVEEIAVGAASHDELHATASLV